MKVTIIPAYSYFGASHRTDICILQSSYLYQKFQQQSVISFSNLHDKDCSRVNQWLGDTLFGNKFTLYEAWTDSLANPNNNPKYISTIAKLQSVTGLHFEYFQVPVEYTNTPYIIPDRIVSLNTNNIGVDGIGSSGPIQTNMYLNFAAPFPRIRFYTTGSDRFMNFNVLIFPDGNLVTENKTLDFEQFRTEKLLTVNVDITASYSDPLDESSYEINTIRIEGSFTFQSNVIDDLNRKFSDFDITLSGITEEDTDPDNPYGKPDSSTTGGGDGSYGNPNAVDPAVIPPLPNINVCDLGLITMYNPSQSQVKALANFLWSDTFDLNTYKKLFGDPMDGIIGLAIVPVQPTLGGTKNVKLGNIDSDVNMPFLASNWAEIDCGWVSVEKYVGCFMDADPYTKISVYLPFIGIRGLSADDINGGEIHIVYHVDVLTGACACFIEHSERGVLYTYNGSCITNVPLTAINFSGAIQNAVSAVISGIGVAAGMATGAAPVTAMGAAGLLNSAANAALNSKPQVQRSGNLGGSAGILSILNPYIIIERPDLSVPYNIQKYVGQTCNITYYLSELSGFTMCEYVHIENCTGTTEEVKEIESLLKEGVYL